MKYGNGTRADDAVLGPTPGAPGTHRNEGRARAASSDQGRAGTEVVDTIDLAAEDAYWRNNFSARPYVDAGSSYDDYGPAYKFGADAFCRFPGRSWDEVERAISRQWIARSGASMLGWDEARHAARDAWQRVNRTP